jgi:hypothetical protein
MIPQTVDASNLVPPVATQNEGMPNPGGTLIGRHMHVDRHALPTLRVDEDETVESLDKLLSRLTCRKMIAGHHMRCTVYIIEPAPTGPK